jgi:hypothetical protein
MGLTETLVFYLLVGVAVAVAVFLGDRGQSVSRTGFLLLTSALFWPLYLPILLSARTARNVATEKTSKPKPDEMASAIAQVELELDAALSSLGGWAENALSCEKDRIAELRHALAAQAGRIREMDDLLSRTATTEIEPPAKPQVDGPTAHDAVDRWQKSQHARAQNVSRLAQVRRQAHADLMATLAWIRELVSMIHLAKFTGAPASRAEELVAQIAAAVEGVSAVVWQDPEPLPHNPAQPQPPLRPWLPTETGTVIHH